MTPRTRTRSRWQVLAVIAVLVGLLAAVCSSSDDSQDDNGGGSSDTSAASGDLAENVPVDAPGVTDTEITYSVLASATGDPTGQCGLPCFETGIQAYFDYVNTEKGGIYGRRLVAAEGIDDEFGKNLEKALEVIAADDTFGTFSNSSLPTGYQSFADEQIPLYVWASNPVAMQGNESIWGENTVRCLQIGCWDRVVPYLMKVSGRHKLATVGYGIAQSSKDCAQNQAQSVEQAKAQIGSDAEAVYVNDNLPFGMPNGAAPEVTAMKNAGADIMATCIVNSDVKTIMQEAKRQGLDILPLLTNIDEEALVSAAGAFDGGYFRNAVRPFAADLNEAQEKYNEYVEKNGGKTAEITLYGWINAALAYEGLVQAGPDFSREKVVEGTNTLTGFTAAGLTAPMNWTTGHTAPTPTDTSNNNEFECYGISKIDGGELVLEGDPAKPFTCWPGTDDWQWTSGWPQDMSFD
ncbi:MAG TPA: ABC transporter substrate-binding protein [Acidimicrobiales bacterium]